MMKKFLYLATIGLLFASCEEDNNADAPDNGVSVQYKVACHIASLDGSQKAMPVFNVPFNLKYEYVNNTMVIATEDLDVSLQTSLSFTSDPVPFTAGSYTEGAALKFSVPSINVLNNGRYDNTYMVKNLSATLTNIYYCPSDWRQTAQYPLGDMLIMNFQLGDQYKVRTFPLLAFYSGVTTSSFSMQGQEQSYSSDMTLYGVAIDPNNNTAEVGIYNAKFADPMPQLTMTLKDLMVEYTDDGYVIKAGEEGVIPLVGTDNVPYPDYVFNKFEMKCEGENLTGVNIIFQVAGRFNGKFNGAFTSVHN